jgi:light-dependent protochlorophyllide reductase
MATGKQTAIVTGGNTGLGYAAARALAESDQCWHVVIACRNPARAAQAVETITNRTAKGRVEAMALDLSSMASVRAFAQVYAGRNLPPLRGVVLNAGSQFVKGTTYTQDGFEATFGVNHLGHFLLANLLLPHISPSARIVFVSSGTHDPDQWTGMPAPQLRDAVALAYPKEDAAAGESSLKVGQRRYTTSKLCNVLCAYELARHLQAGGQAVAVNAFDPGLMPGSGLAREYGPASRFVWNFVLPLLRLVVKNVNSTQSSGRNLARLILDPGLESVTGKYFVGASESQSSKESYDAVKAKALWDGSARLVGLPVQEITAPAARYH